MLPRRRLLYGMRRNLQVLSRELGRDEIAVGEQGIAVPFFIYVVLRHPATRNLSLLFRSLIGHRGLGLGFGLVAALLGEEGDQIA